METTERIKEFMEVLNGLGAIPSRELIAIALYQESQKDRRGQAASESKAWQYPKLATDKQIDFMKRHGITYPEGVSRQEASHLIDAFTNSKR